MSRPRLRTGTERALFEGGYHVSSLYQPQALFPDDGRKLKQVAQKGDPWLAQIFYPASAFEGGEPVPWFASFIQTGQGPTADEAVLDALARTKGLEGCYRKLGAAIDQLTDVLRVA